MNWEFWHIRLFPSLYPHAFKIPAKIRVRRGASVEMEKRRKRIADNTSISYIFAQKYTKISYIYTKNIIKICKSNQNF